jgi:hypothetical protein
MTTATWVPLEQTLGGSVPGASADSASSGGGGPTVGVAGALPPVGAIRKFYDSTGKYGVGEFIYLPGVASLAVGDVVSYNLSAGVNGTTDATVVRWAGTANTGSPLAVAMTANTSSTTYSWYQIEGAAVINTSGTVAAGDSAYWSSTATLKSAAAAGKQVLGAIAFSANGVPAANQAVYTINRPHSQGAIT